MRRLASSCYKARSDTVKHWECYDPPLFRILAFELNLAVFFCKLCVSRIQNLGHDTVHCRKAQVLVQNLVESRYLFDELLHVTVD